MQLDNYEAWQLWQRGTGNYEPISSKASGVIELARYLEHSIGQIMAIGDNNNDIEMLVLLVGESLWDRPPRQ